MEKNEIIKQYGVDYQQMTMNLLEQANLQELIEKKDACIGIKPNLVCPVPADYGATTHPEVVEGIILYLKKYGFERIVILEGSWVGDRTQEAYECCGYDTLAERYQIELIDTQKDSFHEKDCKGMKLQICNVVDRIDFLINVPVLKGHCQTNITCALKNLKGLIPNSEKRHFHTMGLHQPIAHLSQGIRQDFIVIDHICGDLSFEEGGNPVKTDCIMVARDPVLVDSYVCKLLGYDLSQVPYIIYAKGLGSGECDLTTCKVCVIDENRVEVTTFRGDEEDPYEGHTKVGAKLLEISYAVDDYDSCSACYGNLAPALYRLKMEGKLETLSEMLGCQIAIGQGHRGKGGKMGIGNCCKNYENYIKGCPPREEEIYQTFQQMLSSNG